MRLNFRIDHGSLVHPTLSLTFLLCLETEKYVKHNFLQLVSSA